MLTFRFMYNYKFLKRNILLDGYQLKELKIRITVKPFVQSPHEIREILSLRKFYINLD